MRDTVGELDNPIMYPMYSTVRGAAWCYRSRPWGENVARGRISKAGKTTDTTDNTDTVNTDTVTTDTVTTDMGREAWKI